MRAGNNTALEPAMNGAANERSGDGVRRRASALTGPQCAGLIGACSK
jgi:hypothetical protein